MSVVVVCPDLSTADLAVEGLGEAIHVLNDSGVLVGSGVFLNVILKLLRKLLGGNVSIAKNDSSLYVKAADGIGYTCNGALKYSGMLKEHALDLKGTDTVA